MKTSPENYIKKYKVLYGKEDAYSNFQRRYVISICRFEELSAAKQWKEEESVHPGYRDFITKTEAEKWLRSDLCTGLWDVYHPAIDPESIISRERYNPNYGEINKKTGKPDYREYVL